MSCCEGDALQQDQASLDSSQASLDAARRELDVLTAQRSAAEATVRLDEAQLDQARLNLSYTQIRAPIDGTVGERSVQVGNYVNPGTTLMTVVPLDQVYIEANYREVDLLHVCGGQPGLSRSWWLRDSLWPNCCASACRSKPPSIPGWKMSWTNSANQSIA
jgi:multidrug resistance efflux pump